ncbi:MAG: hypothetical protein IPJ40_04965 [Saprospirales bacterium]|nr:hypothetical protein [Saprospirales bacterium]
MDPLAYLQSLQTELKMGVAEDLEKTLEKLFPLLSRSSPLINEFLQLEGTFNQVEAETRKGIIEFNFRLLQLNRIRAGAIELIDKIELADLNPATNPEVKAVLESISTIPASPPAHQNAAAISLSDFDLFISQHQSILHAFPRIFRSARSILVRNDKNNPEIQSVFQAIQHRLPSLEQYETLLAPIREKINKIRLQRENQPFWIRYKQLNEVASTLEVETISELEKALPELEELHKELKGEGLI